MIASVLDRTMVCATSSSFCFLLFISVGEPFSTIAQIKCEMNDRSSLVVCARLQDSSLWFFFLLFISLVFTLECAICTSISPVRRWFQCACAQPMRLCATPHLYSLNLCVHEQKKKNNNQPIMLANDATFFTCAHFFVFGDQFASD